MHFNSLNSPSISLSWEVHSLFSEPKVGILFPLKALQIQGTLSQIWAQDETLARERGAILRRQLGRTRREALADLGNSAAEFGRIELGLVHGQDTAKDWRI